ncbi:TPA: restriction endonuclease subunit S [Aeromonas veronii]
MVPKGWESKELQYLCKKIAVGLAISVTPFMKDRGVKLIRNQNIKRNYFNSDSVVYIDELFANSNKSKKVRHGDVVAVRTGSNIGEACVVPKEFDGALTFTTLIARPNPEFLDSFYLSTHINSDHGVAEVNRLCAGGGKPNLNSGELKRYRLLTPPLPEQKKIAKILSTWDKAISTTEQLLANSQQQKMALMQQLLTGKKRLLDSNGVRFSGDFTSIKVKDLVDIFYGKSPKEILSSSGDFPIYGTGGISGYSSEALCFDASVLIGRKGTIDRPVYIETPFWAIDTTFYCLPKSQTNLKWFYYLVSNIDLKKYSEASGVPSLSRETIYSIKVTITTNLEEQQKIAAVLSTADKEITTLQQKLDALKQEKKALMQQLLTGKRRVKVGEAA